MYNYFPSLAAVLAGLLITLSGQSVADDFPEALVKKQLLEAQKIVSVDTSRLSEGGLLKVAYVGRPVYIYRRTASDIAAIPNIPESSLADPHGANLQASIRSEYGSTSSSVWARLLLLSQPISVNQPYRSIDKGLLVVAGWSPESGCSLSFIGDPKTRPDPAVIFRDPCTGAIFDASGRVFSGKLTVPYGSRFATYNLAIPPYRIEQTGKLVIGPAPKQEIPELNFTRDDFYHEKDPTKILIMAARYNDIETAKVALNQGAKADFFKQGEGSPIDAAIIGSSMDVIKLLITHGAKPTPNSLNAAKAVNRQEVIELLGLVAK